MADERAGDDTLMSLLTPTEFRVVILVGSGLKNTDIAKVMNTTEGVVKNFIRDIFARARISSRIELALRYTHELEVGLYDQERLSQEIAELEPSVNRVLNADSSSEQ